MLPGSRAGLSVSEGPSPLRRACAAQLDPTGVPDFTGVWQYNNASCTTDPLHDEPVASSPAEKAAVAASGHDATASPIGQLYADCAQRFDLKHVAAADGRLGPRVSEYRGVLVL